MKSLGKIKTKIYLTLFMVACCIAILSSGSISTSVNADVSRKSIQHNNRAMPGLTGEKARDYLKEQGLNSSLQKAIEKAQYSITPKSSASNTLEAVNQGQAFITKFTSGGIRVESTSATDNWNLSMSLAGFGDGGAMKVVAGNKPQVQKDKSRIEIEKFSVQNPKQKIVEWFENRSDGLEQGWTVPDRLSDQSETLNLVLKLAGNLQPELTGDKQSIYFKDHTGERILTYDKLKSWDAKGVELKSEMQLESGLLTIIVDDRNAKYPVTVDPVIRQTKKLVSSIPGVEHGFGSSVSISGDTLVVGEDQNNDLDTLPGAAYIFERNQGGSMNWGLVKRIVLSDGVGGDFFGASVSISGNKVIVGAPRRDGIGQSSGVAFIFGRNTGGANNWGLDKTLVASDQAAFDNFGDSVSISGSGAIVSAYRNSDTGTLSGSAYVFEKDTGGIDNWGEVKKLLASDSAAGDEFGRSVSIDGDSAAVGAPAADVEGALNAGAVYIFRRSQGGINNWGEVRKLVFSAPGPNHRYGGSVSISGNSVAIGALGINATSLNLGDVGAAFIHDRNAGGTNNWGFVRGIYALGQTDQFGTSLSLDGNVLVISSPGRAGAGTDTGLAGVYLRNEGGANEWGLVKNIFASDGNAGDDFGGTVAVSGNTIVAGVRRDSDIEFLAGSAYVFTTDNSAIPFDFDGDGKSDLSIFRPGPGEWWYLRSSDFGNRGFQFGASMDKPVPADFTGDGKTDIAFWRNGEWFVLRSEDNSFYSVPFGSSGDIPAPGDFDGDGKADTAVYRPSNQFWYIQNSSGGTTFQQFGVAEDKPTVADFDGDGKDDIAVYRPSVSQWWQFRSTDGVIGYQFGTTGDKTVQGDFTGDGKADVALFRPSDRNWYVLRSEDSSFYSVPFGLGTDIPVAGDYDGDGKFDTAVFRPSDNNWYVQGSTSGFFQIGFGISGDIPLPGVYFAP